MKTCYGSYEIINLKVSIKLFSIIFVSHLTKLCQVKNGKPLELLEYHVLPCC